MIKLGSFSVGRCWAFINGTTKYSKHWYRGHQMLSHAVKEWRKANTLKSVK